MNDESAINVGEGCLRGLVGVAVAAPYCLAAGYYDSGLFWTVTFVAAFVAPLWWFLLQSILESRGCKDFSHRFRIVVFSVYTIYALIPIIKNVSAKLASFLGNAVLQPRIESFELGMPYVVAGIVLTIVAFTVSND